MTPRNSSVCQAASFVLLAVALPLAAADLPAGLQNFEQVNEHLFRGAQPSGEGFRSLQALGVKVVLDLRESGSRSRAEAAQVQALGMRYVNIPLSGISAPSAAQTAQILALFNDANSGPVFVHCRRGADRTGTMVAIYRISHDHWDNARALAEARSHKMAGWEKLMQSYVLNYRPDVLAADPQPKPVSSAGGAQ